MPDYVLLADLHAKIPPDFIVQAMDDNNDGVADVGIWDSILKAVSTEINGTLSVRFKTPFGNPLPGIVQQAALIFACSSLYERRAISDDKNPFAKERDAIRKQLGQIAAGDLPLNPSLDRAQPSVSVISEPARAQSTKAKLSV